MPHPGGPADRRAERQASPAPPPREPARSLAAAAQALVQDEQTLLAGVVERLQEITGCELSAVWAQREDGTPYLAAASFEGPPPGDPDPEAFAAAAALAGATDLRSGQAPPALAALFDGYRSAAAAPATRSDPNPLAVLFLAGREVDAARPRSLAALDAAAHRVARPLAAARVARRLAELDAESHRLDRLSTLGSLAVEIAHEVRNPLVSVKSFLQLLPEHRDDPEFLTGFLDVASQELQRVERLLDLLIQYPRERNDPQRASAGGALESTAELLRHLMRARGLHLDTAGEAPLPEVAVSEDSLRQLLLNLALNAVGVTPQGGCVRLTARAVGKGVELRVVDQGPGVAEEERRRVFEPFHSTRPGSHGGLGLWITRRIVEEAGGSIAIEDAAGGGAAFRVWLPAAVD